MFYAGGQEAVSGGGWLRGRTHKQLKTGNMAAHAPSYFPYMRYPSAVQYAATYGKELPGATT